MMFWLGRPGKLFDLPSEIYPGRANEFHYWHTRVLTRPIAFNDARQLSERGAII